MSEEFIIGGVYFYASFLDNEYTVPEIYTMYFLGKNVEDYEEGDVWYFQDAVSYHKYGRYNEISLEELPEGEVNVQGFKEDSFPDIKDLSGLHKFIGNILDRKS